MMSQGGWEEVLTLLAVRGVGAWGRAAPPALFALVPIYYCCCGCSVSLSLFPLECVRVPYAASVFCFILWACGVRSHRCRFSLYFPSSPPLFTLLCVMDWCAHRWRNNSQSQPSNEAGLASRPLAWSLRALISLLTASHSPVGQQEAAPPPTLRKQEGGGALANTYGRA